MSNKSQAGEGALGLIITVVVVLILLVVLLRLI